MSHNIQENDKIVATKSTWHCLESLVSNITFNNSGLDWEVVRRSIQGLGVGLIPEYRAIVRSDNNLVLQVAKDSYKTIQNERIWDLVHESLAGVNFEVNCCGSLGDCRKVFISVGLKDDQKWLVNGDEFKNNIIFTSSHDGSHALEAFDSSTRVVCQNTLNWARSNKSGKLNLRVRHTRNAKLFIDNMEAEIEKLFSKRGGFYMSLEWLAEKPMSTSQANKILTGILVDSPKTEISTRVKNQKNDILNRFKCGIATNGETRYDLLNGITEYYTRNSNKSNTLKNYQSSEFGNGAAKKLEAYETLLSDEKLDQLAKKGEEALRYNELTV